MSVLCKLICLEEGTLPMLALSVGVLFEISEGNNSTYDANERIKICWIDRVLVCRTIVLFVVIKLYCQTH